MVGFRLKEEKNETQKNNRGGGSPLDGILKFIAGEIGEIEKKYEQLHAVKTGTTKPIEIKSKEFADVEVDFETPFESAPDAVCCLNSTSSSSDIGSITATIYSIDADQMIVRVFNNSENKRAPSVKWIAVGK